MSDGDDQEQQPTLRAFSLRDLEGLEFPPVTFVVDDLIPAGSLSLMVGRPKAGKSLVAIDLLSSIATGDTFLDKATAQGPAIYVPAEDALSLVRSRLWTRLEKERDAPLYVVPADGSMDQSLRLDDGLSFDGLADVIHRIKPAMVVLDPLRELHRKKENDADEMAELLRPLRQISHESDTSIVLIHHKNKYGADPSTASRGSSAIVGSVDQIITLDLTGDDDDNDLSPHRTLKIEIEGRYGPRIRLQAQLRPGLRWTPTKAKPLDDLDAPQRIWRHLEMTGHTLTAEQLVEAVKASKSTVQDGLSQLVKAGRIRRKGSGSKGAPYSYIASEFDAGDSFGDDTRTFRTNRTNEDKTTETSANHHENSSGNSSGDHFSGVVILECGGCGRPRGGADKPCPHCGARTIIRTMH